MGYSRIKGYIDENLQQDLILEKISKILIASNPKVSSIGQAYGNVWKPIRLFQVARPSSLNNLEAIIQMYLHGKDDDWSIGYSSFDMNSFMWIITPVKLNCKIAKLTIVRLS